MTRFVNCRSAVTAIATTILLILTGCKGDYGRLKLNPDLTVAFKNQLELPDYNYYFCGRARLPYAVVGIDPEYEFESKTWQKIETREDVHKKTAGVLAWNQNWSKGSDILDPAGKKIGIWFSYYRSTVVKVGPENKVAVYNPWSPTHDRMDTRNNPGP